MAAVLSFAAPPAFAQSADALVALINSEDKAAGADALTEYRRRVALLPSIEKGRAEGNPTATEAFSLKGLQQLDEELTTELGRAKSDEKLLSKLALKDVKETIPRIPGPPLLDLAARRLYWQKQRVGFRKYADALGRMIDPENQKTRIDEFGDAVLESLPRLREQQERLSAQARSETLDLADRIDALVKPLNTDSRMGLPLLSGLTLVKLLQVLKTYRAGVKAVKLANDGSNAANQAAANLPLIPPLAAAVERGALRWARADALSATLDSDVAALSLAQAGFGDLARMVDDVLADSMVDEDFAEGRSGELYAPARDRKLAAVKKMTPTLKNAKDLLENGLIPYQRRRVAEASPRVGRLARDYESRIALLTSLLDGK